MSERLFLHSKEKALALEPKLWFLATDSYDLALVIASAAATWAKHVRSSEIALNYLDSFSDKLWKIIPQMCCQPCYWPRLGRFHMLKGKYGSFSSTKGELLAALSKLRQRLQVVTSEMTLREHVHLQSLKTLKLEKCTSEAWLARSPNFNITGQQFLQPPPPLPSRMQMGRPAGGCDPAQRDTERSQHQLLRGCPVTPRASSTGESARTSCCEGYAVSKYILAWWKITTVSSINSANTFFLNVTAQLVVISMVQFAN